MNFAEFQQFVSLQDDPVAKRFAKSLGAWVASKAGEGLLDQGPPAS